MMKMKAIPQRNTKDNTKEHKEEYKEEVVDFLKVSLGDLGVKLQEIQLYNGLISNI
jgi:hypothetical protein